MGGGPRPASLGVPRVYVHAKNASPVCRRPLTSLPTKRSLPRLFCAEAQRERERAFVCSWLELVSFLFIHNSL
jgi:hypothetical protein